VRRRRDFGTVRKLPSGYYQAFIRREGRTIKAPQTYRAKADALAWLNLQASDMARGTWADNSDPKLTVATLASKWQEAGVTKEALTRKRELSVLKKYVLPDLGDAKVTKLTQAQVQKVVDSWVVAGLAPTTVCSMAYCLGAMFNFACASGVIKTSPAAKLRLPKTSLVDRPVLSPDELERLAEALTPGDAAMMWVGVVGGLRWSECAALTVQSLDLLTGTISVVRSKTEAGKRKLAIPEWLVDELAAHLAHRGLTAAEADELVFVAPQGGALRYPNWLERTWHPACRAAGLPRLKFHDLRSMAATALLAANVDVRTAQTRLGHASPTVTLGIYARATVEADRRAAEAVGAALRPDSARRVHTVKRSAL
jgi:integrase